MCNGICFWKRFSKTIYHYKKVLLHTVCLPRSKYSLCCSVSEGGSTQCCPGHRERYPSPVLARRVPQSCPGRGVTPVLSWLGGGVPQARTGVPLPQDWVSPGQDWGTPLARTGYPPRKDLGPGTWERTWDWGTPWKGCGTRDLGKPGTGVPSPHGDVINTGAGEISQNIHHKVLDVF